MNDDLIWVRRGDVKKTWSENMGHAISATDTTGKVYNRLYEIGGQVSYESNCTRNVNYYDVDTATWTKLPDLAQGISHAAMAVDGTTLWMAGGYLEGDLDKKRYSADAKIYGTTSVRKLNIITKIWSNGPSLPVPRAGGALIHLGHFLYFSSGSDIKRKDVGNLYALDLNGGDTASWKELTGLPGNTKDNPDSARNHIGGLAFDGRAWVVVGQTGQNSAVVYRSRIDAYDPRADSWSRMPDLPAPPRSHAYSATFLADHRIVVLGGLTFTPGKTSGEFPLNKINVFDGDLQTWNTLPPLPSSFSFPVAGWFHDSTIVVSGSHNYVLEGIHLPHPTNLTSDTGTQDGKVTLRWTNQAQPISGYTLGVKVERKSGANGTWAVVSPILPVGTTTWQDKGLSLGATYLYRVSAIATADIAPGSGTSRPSTEWTVVTGTAQGPSALSGKGVTQEDKSTDFDLNTVVKTGNHSLDQLKFSLSAPLHGSVTLLADGHIAHFVPTPHYFGPAGFIYTVTDPILNLSSTAQVSIDVTLVHTPPIARSLTKPIAGDTVTQIDLWSLTSDAETAAPQLHFVVYNSLHGKTTLLPDDHTAQFTPTPGFSGSAAFSYTVTDTAYDARLLFLYDYEPSSRLNSRLIPDVTGLGKDAAVETIGTGHSQLLPDPPVPLSPSDTEALRLNASGNNGVRLKTVIAKTDLDLGNADWTMTTWIKRVTRDTEDYIFYIGAGDGNGGSGDELYLELAANSDQLQLIHFDHKNNNDVRLNSSTVLPSNQWHHVALGFTSTAPGTGTFRIYLDGALVGTVSGVAWQPHQEMPLILGGHAATTTNIDRYFDGLLDETAFFRGALSPAEIGKLAQERVVTFGGLSASNTVTFNVGESLAAWRIRYFGLAAHSPQAADTGDPDRDGLPNLLEYALGTNPLSPTNLPATVLKTVGNKLTLSFNRLNPAPVTYLVEGSNALTSSTFWTPITMLTPTAPWSVPALVQESGNGATTTVSVTDTVTLANSPRFVRLRVIAP